MDHTPRLSLPFIIAGQAQKHITHNEALQALDALVQLAVSSRSTTTPPATPVEGETYLVPAGATGDWAGHTDEIVSYQSASWLFLDPAPGWQLYCLADRTQWVFDDSAWHPLASLGDALPHLGINTSADTTNRLALASPASLFTHAGAGHQLKLNKATPGDTASLLYQTNWSGRAEMGLTGSDDWQLKLSPDGASWINALSFDATTGNASFAASVRPATDNAVTLGAAGARWSAIWSATGTIQTSDSRAKTDIAPSDLGLDFICALNPVRFRYRDGSPDLHYGLLAQQVQQLLDGRSFAGHVLADPTDPNSEQALRYDAFIAPIITAIQQLAERLDPLTDKLRSKSNTRQTPMCCIGNESPKDDKMDTQIDRSYLEVDAIEIVKHRSLADVWTVEAIEAGGEGACYVTTFYGPLSQSRASKYAAWIRSQKATSA